VTVRVGGRTATITATETADPASHDPLSGELQVRRQFLNRANAAAAASLSSALIARNARAL